MVDPSAAFYKDKLVSGSSASPRMDLEAPVADVRAAGARIQRLWLGGAARGSPGSPWLG